MDEKLLERKGKQYRTIGIDTEGINEGDKVFVYFLFSGGFIK